MNSYHPGEIEPSPLFRWFRMNRTGIPIIMKNLAKEIEVLTLEETAEKRWMNFDLLEFRICHPQGSCMLGKLLLSKYPAVN